MTTKPTSISLNLVSTFYDTALSPGPGGLALGGLETDNATYLIQCLIF